MKRSCLCGCGRSTGATFATGCDQRARTRLIALMYKNTADFLEAHGFGRDGKNLHDAWIDSLDRRAGGNDDDDPYVPAMEVPELNAVVVLCPAGCAKGYHSHGSGSLQGHRVSHCKESRSPSGYYLREARSFERDKIRALLQARGRI